MTKRMAFSCAGNSITVEIHLDNQKGSIPTNNGTVGRLRRLRRNMTHAVRHNHGSLRLAATTFHQGTCRSYNGTADIFAMRTSL